MGRRFIAFVTIFLEWLIYVEMSILTNLTQM